MADVKSKGTVEAFITDIHDIERMYKIHEILFVPSYNVNLMSVSRAEAKGKTFIFKSNEQAFRCGEDEALPMCLRGQLLYFRCKISAESHSAKESRDATLWHLFSTMSRRCSLISTGPIARSVKCVRCPSFMNYQFESKPRPGASTRKSDLQRHSRTVRGASLHVVRCALTFIRVTIPADLQWPIEWCAKVTPLIASKSTSLLRDTNRTSN